MNDLSWPLWTLEMAPSSSSSESHPIEVGVACWTSPSAHITTWSSCIDPSGTSDWEDAAPAALAHVGIAAKDLTRGMTPEQMARKLNDIFLNSTVYGQGGTIDVHLANRLNLAARVWPTYSLKNWREICDRHPDKAKSAWTIMRSAKPGAGARACGTMQAIAHLLDRNPECRSVPTMAVSLPI